MELQTKPPERLTITVKELAQLLGLGVNKAYTLVKEGRIPSIRIGRQIRISKKALNDWLDRESGILPQDVLDECDKA